MEIVNRRTGTVRGTLHKPSPGAHDRRRLYPAAFASGMEEPMRKTKMQKRPKSTDTLLKTTKKKDIELTEKELGQVTGGKGHVDYLTVKLTDVIISGVSPGGSGKD